MRWYKSLPGHHQRRAGSSAKQSRAAAATLPCVMLVVFMARNLAVPALLAALPDMSKLISGLL